jgi:anaphase-promoting complex subunit 7
LEPRGHKEGTRDRTIYHTTPHYLKATMSSKRSPKPSSGSMMRATKSSSKASKTTSTTARSGAHVPSSSRGVPRSAGGAGPSTQDATQTATSGIPTISIPVVEDMDRVLSNTATLLNECFTLFQTRQYKSCETLVHYATSSIERALLNGSSSGGTDLNSQEATTAHADYYSKLHALLSLHATALELQGDVLANAGAATTNGVTIKPQTRRALCYYRRATQQQFHLHRMVISGPQKHKQQHTHKQSHNSIKTDPSLASKAIMGIVAPDPNNIHASVNEDIQRQQGSLTMSRVGASASPTQINLALKQVQCYLSLELYSNAYHMLHGLLVQSSTKLAQPEFVTFELCMQFATLCVACARNTEAETWFLKAVQKNPYCVEALEVLSGILHVDRAAVTTAMEEGIQLKMAQHDSERKGSNINTCTEQMIAPLREMLAAMYVDSENQLLTALTKYRALLERYPNHVQLLIKIALLELYTGDYTSSELSFAHARQVDPNIMDHMDEYAYLLSRRRPGLTELNQLAQEMLESNDSRPEPWVCLALYHQKRNLLALSSPSNTPANTNNNNTDKPLQLVDRALRLNVRHAFGHRTRGMFLLAENRAEEAATSFYYANQVKKDVANYEGLVEAYIVQGDKYKEAVCMAKEAMTIAPKDPRTFTLIGLALSHSPQTSEGGKEKAKRAFRKALLVDPYALRPMFALADMYLEEEEFAEAIELLCKASQGHGRQDEHDMIHGKLADVYSAVEQFDSALSHYHTALSMNPENLDAQRGLERLERLMRGQDPDHSSDTTGNGNSNGHSGDYSHDAAQEEGATNFEQDTRAYM